jgi:hypothetical protein
VIIRSNQPQNPSTHKEKTPTTSHNPRQEINAVFALALLRFVGALELDQMRAAGMLLAELQPTACDLEIRVALRYLAAVLRSERSTYLQ